MLPVNKFQLKFLNIDSTTVHNLERFNKRTSFEDMNLPFQHKFTELKELNSIILQFISQTHLNWYPLLGPTNKISDGQFFQVCVEKEDKINVLAIGELQEIVKTAILPQSVYTIRMSTLLLAKYLNFKENYQILITSYEDTVEKDKYMLSTILYNSNIKNDVYLGHPDDITDGIFYVIVVKPNKILKLRDVMAKSEKEVEWLNIVPELNALLGLEDDKVQFKNFVQFERKKLKRSPQLFQDKLSDYLDILQRLPIFVVEIDYKQLFKGLYLDDIDEENKNSIKQIHNQVKIHGKILIMTSDGQHKIYP